MRCILLMAFVCSIVVAHAQDDATAPSQKSQSLSPFSDSVYKKEMDSINNATLTNSYRESIDRMQENSLNFFMQLQKERKAKEKRQAMIRIGLGVAFLAILIVGLRRRRLKK